MKFLNVLPAFLLLAACSSNAPASKKPVDSTPAQNVALKKDPRKLGGDKAQEQVLIDEAMAKMKNHSDSTIGFWVGSFGHNKINIAIAEVRDGQALGYTVCAGNFRPVTGTVKQESKNLYSFVLNEPGSDKYDGHFEFTINTADNALKGSWAPFKEGSTEKKTFELHKTFFAYRNDVGQYPVASQRPMTKEDVENMMKEDLTVMRNEIYARHGYSFKNKNIRAVFDTASWYVPMGIDIRENLSDMEAANIELIYNYEKYYADSYDDYGR